MNTNFTQPIIPVYRFVQSFEQVILLRRDLLVTILFQIPDLLPRTILQQLSSSLLASFLSPYSPSDRKFVETRPCTVMNTRNIQILEVDFTEVLSVGVFLTKGWAVVFRNKTDNHHCSEEERRHIGTVCCTINEHRSW